VEANTQCSDLNDQVRVSITFKNVLIRQVLAKNPQFCLGLIPQVTQEAVFGLPRQVSVHLALCVGKIIDKCMSEE